MGALQDMLDELEDVYRAGYGYLHATSALKRAWDAWTRAGCPRPSPVGLDPLAAALLSLPDRATMYPHGVLRVDTVRAVLDPWLRAGRPVASSLLSQDSDAAVLLVAIDAGLVAMGATPDQVQAAGRAVLAWGPTPDSEAELRQAMADGWLVLRQAWPRQERGWYADETALVFVYDASDGDWRQGWHADPDLWSADDQGRQLTGWNWHEADLDDMAARPPVALSALDDDQRHRVLVAWAQVQAGTHKEAR